MSNENEELQTELIVSEKSGGSAWSLVMNDGAIEKMMAAAQIMAGSKVTIPKHLQGNQGDCMAVIMQSAQWGMNPFAVAQKTHVVNGVLGYEAQLVNAVAQQSGAITGRFQYEYQGEGDSVLCRVGATLRGESEITWGEWLSAKSVTTKNSPLWKTNVKQQMGYLQVKNWSRMYCPGAILGVYTPDELEQIPAEKDVTPKRQTGTQAGEAARAALEPADSDERTNLVKRLEDVAAQYGVDPYAEEWSKLTKEQRKTVGTAEHERLKKIAASIQSTPQPESPSTPTDIDPETGEVVDHE